MDEDEKEFDDVVAGIFMITRGTSFENLRKFKALLTFIIAQAIAHGEEDIEDGFNETLEALAEGINLQLSRFPDDNRKIIVKRSYE
jgi:hypothetical protein